MDIEQLPVNYKLTLWRMDDWRTKKSFGPDGRGEHFYPRPDDGRDVPQWHCVIVPEKTCESCRQDRETAWFKGHGHTAQEAMDEAWQQIILGGIQ